MRYRFIQLFFIILSLISALNGFGILFSAYIQGRQPDFVMAYPFYVVVIPVWLLTLTYLSIRKVF